MDFHCHVLTLAAEPLVADRPQKQAEALQMQAEVGAASMAHNSSVMLPKAFPRLTRLDERLADMDAMNVDMQVLSPSPSQYLLLGRRGSRAERRARSERVHR